MKRARRLLNMNVLAILLLGAAFGISAYRVASIQRELYSPDRIVIRLAHWQLEPGYRDALGDAIAEYNAIHADDDVVVIQMPVTERIYPQWVNVHLLSGDAPDLVEKGKANLTGGANNKPRYFQVLTGVVNKPNPYNRRPGTEFVPESPPSPRTPDAWHARNPGTYELPDGTRQPFLPAGLDEELAELLETRPWRETLTDGMLGGFDDTLQDYYAVPTSFWGTIRIMYNKDALRRAKALARWRLTGEGKPVPGWLSEEGFPRTFGQLMDICETIEDLPNRMALPELKRRLAERYRDRGEDPPGWLAGPDYPDEPSRIQELIEAMAGLSGDARRRARMIPIAGTRYIVKRLHPRFSTIFTASLAGKMDTDHSGEVTSLESVAAYIRGDWSFETPSVRAWLECLQALTEQFPHGFMGMGRDTSVHMFVQEMAAMRGSGTWDAYSLLTAAEFEVGIHDFVLPAEDERFGAHAVARPNEAQSAGGAPWMVSKFSKHKDWAIDFQQFFTSYRWNQKFNRNAHWLPVTMGTSPAPVMEDFVPNPSGVPSKWRVRFDTKTQLQAEFEGLLWKYLNKELTYDQLGRQLGESITDSRYGADRVWHRDWQNNRDWLRNQDRGIAAQRVRLMMLGDEGAALRLRKALTRQALDNDGETYKARYRDQTGKPFPEF